METWGYLQRVRYGTWQCAGLGLVAGALESAWLASELVLPLSLPAFVVLGLGAMLVNALAALALGLVPGLLFHLETPEPEEGTRTSTLLSRQLAATGLLLTGLYLWQGAARLWADGAEPAAVAAMSAMPLGFAGVVFYNARFWLRRTEVGRAPRIGWVPTAALVGALVVGIGAVAASVRDTGGTWALEGDRNVVVVTVDGLRRDQVGFLGGPATPALDALATESVVFANAVTPTPGSRAANAAVLVGLHPLRHKALDDADRLSRGYRSLFEVLEKEGYATGAFVSSSVAAAGSGLDQGFRVYDDDFLPALFGTARVNLVGHALALLGRVTDPDGIGPLHHRDAGATLDRFEGWLSRKQDLPFAAWIHLADPHTAAVAGRDPAAAVAEVDAAIGRLVDALRDAGVIDETVLVVTGTHGELLGAHGGTVNRTLFDEVVRVPMLVRAPGPAVVVPRVEAQVRLMDVPATVLDWLGLDPLDESEGIALNAYGAGTRKATIWCALVGRDLDGGWLLGLRNNGVKYMVAPDGRERLFLVEDDPTEATDLSAEAETTRDQARSLLTSDKVALERLVGR